MTAHGPIKLKDIARECNVSLSTVSKVVNGRTDVAEETRRIVEAALSKVGYVHKQPSKQNRYIEIVFQFFNSMWAFELLEGLVEKADSLGYAVSVAKSQANMAPSQDSEWIKAVLDRKPAGVILVFSDLTDAQKEMFRTQNIPFVILDPDGELSPNDYSVRADNWSGGLIATRHLLSMGHTSIGIITGPSDMMCSNARLDGFKSALTDAGVSFNEDFMREGAFTYATGLKCGLEILSQPNRPTAIFAGSDLQALGVYEAARQLGLSIPDDLSVVGFDNIEVASMIAPSLTTINQPLAQMAGTALSMLDDILNNREVSQSVVLPTTFVSGASTCELTS